MGAVKERFIEWYEKNGYEFCVCVYLDVKKDVCAICDVPSYAVEYCKDNKHYCLDCLLEKFWKGRENE